MTDKEYQEWLQETKNKMYMQFIEVTIKPENKAIWIQAYTFLYTKDKEWLLNNQPTYELLLKKV